MVIAAGYRVSGFVQWHIAVAASDARASGSHRGYNGHSSTDVRAPHYPLARGRILDRTFAEPCHGGL